MPRGNLKVRFFNDFTGGLNNNSQRQLLAANESPDCLNMEFNNRGGFSLRRGYATVGHNSGLLGGAVIGQWSDVTTEYLWGVRSDGGMWTMTDDGVYSAPSTTNLPALSSPLRAATWDGKLYFANWVSSNIRYVKRYNSGFTTLGVAANNNYTAPTGGNGVQARLIANHSGHMFWADTEESGLRYRSRVRFSHPLQPEDFAAADYFDIETDDGTNQITALVPFRNMLLVFKQRGVFAIYGTARDSFVVERVSTQAGVFSQEGVCTSANSAFWWSTDGNVYAFDGDSVTPIGDRIVNIYESGSIAAGGDHRTMWADERLWVSLDGPGTTRYLYVYDPAVGSQGAWTQFNFAPTSMFWWRQSSGATKTTFMLNGGTDILYMGGLTQQTDETNGVAVRIDGHYKTAWFSAENTALMKRWRRPTITVAARDNCIFTTEVYYDFDEDSVNRTLTLPINAGGTMVWGDPWGATAWQADVNEVVYEFGRLPSLGRSHAIQLKFFASDHNTRWWMDSYAVPYLEKAMR